MCYGAVRAPSTLGLRFLRDNACLLTPVGSSLPTCGLIDLPHVPGCSVFAPLPWQQFCAKVGTLRAKTTGRVDELAWVLGAGCPSEMSHQSPAASTGRTGVAPPTPSLLRITFLSLAQCSFFLMGFLRHLENSSSAKFKNQALALRLLLQLCH